MSAIPSHLTAWAVAQEIPSDGYVYQFAVHCPCGNDHLWLSHSGTVSEHRGEPYPTGVKIGDGYHFVVWAKCPACTREECLFDWGVHGWTCLSGVSRAAASSPKPSPQTWHCSSCRGAEHRIIMRHVLPAVKEYESAIRQENPHAAWADAFVWVGADIECCRCGLFTWLWFEVETL